MSTSVALCRSQVGRCAPWRRRQPRVSRETAQKRLLCPLLPHEATPATPSRDRLPVSPPPQSQEGPFPGRSPREPGVGSVPGDEAHRRAGSPETAAGTVPLSLVRIRLRAVCQNDHNALPGPCLLVSGARLRPGLVCPPEFGCTWGKGLLRPSRVRD